MTAERTVLAQVPSMEELIASPRLVRAMAPEAARDLYVALAPLVAELQITASGPPSIGPVPRVATDVWLTADDVAERLKTTRGAIYGLARRADWRQFCTRPNRRTLRINERGLTRWLARQMPAAESIT